MRRLTCSLAAGLLLAVGCAPAIEQPTEEELGEPIDEVELAAKGCPSPPPAPPLQSVPGPGASMSFEREMKQRFPIQQGIPITQGKYQKPKVIYSLELTGLTAGEKLLLRAEVLISRCNENDIAGGSGNSCTTPCKGIKPYAYTPRVRGMFVLGTSASDAKGVPLDSNNWFSTSCTRRKHHCALSVPQREWTVPAAAAGNTFLNFVVAADSGGKQVKSSDVMELEDGKGGLYVTRLAAQSVDPKIFEATTNRVIAKQLRIAKSSKSGTKPRRVIYQIPVSGVAPGDVISIDAKLRARKGKYRCNPLITTDAAVTPTALGKKISPGQKVKLVLAKNGNNCHDSKQGCPYEKSGAYRLGPADISNGTTYVSYVATAVRQCGGTESVDVLPKGSMTVVVRRSGASDTTGECGCWAKCNDGSTLKIAAEASSAHCQSVGQSFCSGGLASHQYVPCS